MKLRKIYFLVHEKYLTVIFRLLIHMLLLTAGVTLILNAHPCTWVGQRFLFRK
jgi:hypothetical protein